MPVCGGGEEDLQAVKDLYKSLIKDRKHMTKFKSYFGESKEKIDQARRTIRKGDPYEGVTAGTSLGNLEDPAQMAGQRLLAARRGLDDAIKNRDFNKMSKYDRQAILALRSKMNDTLKNGLSGSDSRVAADELYSDYLRVSKDLFDPITSVNPSGASELDISKLGSLLKTQTPRGDIFGSRIKNMEDFLSKSEETIGELPEVSSALNAMKDARSAAETASFVGSMERAGGGPTSQAVNGLMQVAAGKMTGGLSALALPVTNPTAWTKVVDSFPDLGKLKGTKWAGRLEEAAQRGPRAIGVMHHLLQQQDPEYRKKLQEGEDD